MTLWALEIEYDGTPFMGWQRQKHGLAIQQVIEEAISRFQGGQSSGEVIAAGRTDAGVHAKAMIVQAELPDVSPYRIREALNFHLKPHPIAVLRCAPAPAGWNARFSAVARSYRYVILNRPQPPTLEVNRVWHVKAPLDAEAMHKAAQHLLGYHDFSSFRASACQAKSPLRTLDLCTIHRDGDYVMMHTKARSFLHHQVRNMIGSLKMVGQGLWTEQKLIEILAAKSRPAAGQTAPAEGLYFISAEYEPPLVF